MAMHIKKKEYYIILHYLCLFGVRYCQGPILQNKKKKNILESE